MFSRSGGRRRRRVPSLSKAPCDPACAGARGHVPRHQHRLRQLGVFTCPSRNQRVALRPRQLKTTKLKAALRAAAGGSAGAKRQLLQLRVQERVPQAAGRRACRATSDPLRGGRRDHRRAELCVQGRGKGPASEGALTKRAVAAACLLLLQAPPMPGVRARSTSSIEDFGALSAGFKTLNPNPRVEPSAFCDRPGAHEHAQATVSHTFSQAVVLERVIAPFAALARRKPLLLPLPPRLRGVAAPTAAAAAATRAEPAGVLLLRRRCTVTSVGQQHVLLDAEKQLCVYGTQQHRLAGWDAIERAAQQLGARRNHL
eukprot:363288-Chlamydomonas_euryale.AAC.1